MQGHLITEYYINRLASKYVVSKETASPAAESALQRIERIKSH